jgi:hypothetical protein
MPAETAANLFLLEDLEDVSRTSELAESELGALQAVADWIKTFVAKPHKDLGRAGAVCPSCPGPWSARYFGSLLSRSPTGACQPLSSS